MNKEKVAIIMDLILELAEEITLLKEQNLQGSGEVWYSGFIAKLPVPSDFD